MDDRLYYVYNCTTYTVGISGILNFPPLPVNPLLC